MASNKMRELLFSLAWFDASAIHRQRARDMLRDAYPDDDFESTLVEFERCKADPLGEGSPRETLSELERLRTERNKALAEAQRLERIVQKVRATASVAINHRADKMLFAKPLLNMIDREE